MSLRRGRVLWAIALCLSITSTAGAQTQGVPSRLATLQARFEEALATIAKLQADLAAEKAARQAADTALQTSIDGISGGGITQAALDAAMAAEAAAREAGDTGLQGKIDNEAAARKDFDDTLAPLMALAPLADHVSVKTGSINDLAGPHVIFSGVNVHIRSGHSLGDSLVRNGLGNLVIGYNESSGAVPAERSGSHNVIVGPNHRYNWGVGLVVGYANRLGEAGASVTGGAFNDAAGMFSSITAGRGNLASGTYASVSGGEYNTASGATAAVSAGVGNQATGDLSSVSGGSNNAATGVLSTVGGGANLTNSVPFSFIP